MAERPWIVVPCFNEADRLDRRAFSGALTAPGGPCFVFVDDGSSDGTVQVLEALRAHAPDRCDVVRLPQNRGKAEAVRVGLLHALGHDVATVGYWDADLATPLDMVALLHAELSARPAIDVVMGSRVRMLGREVLRSGRRHYIGRAFATAASLALRLPVYDTQCGAKLFRRTDVLARVLSQPFRSRWAFDVELIFRMQELWGDTGEARIVEVPLPRWADVPGSKVSLAGGLRAVWAVALLRLRRGTLAATSPVTARQQHEAHVPE